MSECYLTDRVKEMHDQCACRVSCSTFRASYRACGITDCGLSNHIGWSHSSVLNSRAINYVCRIKQKKLIWSTYDNCECKAVLLIDANNAFHSLNNLHKIQSLYLPVATILINTYSTVYVYRADYHHLFKGT